MNKAFYNPCELKKGFTLMEILVVIGLLAVFATMGLSFSFDSYRGYLFRSEYTSAVNLLAQARNRAINNFNESSHGLAVLDTQYHLLKTNTAVPYNATASSTFQPFERNTALTFSGPTFITFEQVSGDLDVCEDEDGDPVDPCTITFGYGLKTKSITINEVGGIIW